MVSIKSISSVCGISVSTVSKALNGRPDVSSETQAYVRRVAKEMGYLPNSAARTLKTNRSYSIGILFVDKTSIGLAHDYFSTVLGSLQDTAWRRGYDVTYIGKSIGPHDMSYYEHCRYRGCDGIVIASADFTDPAIIELVEGDLPLVTIDHSFDHRPSIMSDNEQGIRDLVSYIHGRGHRKIAFIHGEDTVVTQKRLAGFYGMCSELGINTPAEYVRSALYHEPTLVAQRTRELLSLPDRPTCIMYPDDYTFISGKNVIEEFGLSIPGDISVTGYDGVFFSQIMSPKLTTLKQDITVLGQKAGECLIELIEQPKLAKPRQVVVAGRLLEGNSVKDIR